MKYRRYFNELNNKKLANKKKEKEKMTKNLYNNFTLLLKKIHKKIIKRNKIAFLSPVIKIKIEDILIINNNETLKYILFKLLTK